MGTMSSAPKPATEHTIRRNSTVDVELDPQDFVDAGRGLVASIPGGLITGNGGVAWDASRYEFLDADQPVDTVHPSLWRQARLDNIHGLFEVASGIWQARGYDISNITFIAGATGWIVIDPLTSQATAAACLALANEHLGARPVSAVIYTHSHVDHYGGVRGVTSQDDVDAGRCMIIAPDGFMREVVAENVIGGPAMLRRALYQFGSTLPAGPRGHVDCGLGKAMPLRGPIGLLAPTHSITATGEEMVVDGIRIVFQNTPQSEAPAEMHFYFPDQRWLCLAENCTHTMHNLVPIRGAQVRDALAWSKYIGEALDMFGAHAEVAFASHHWPTFGNDQVRRYMGLQRALYRWIHDQTMRQAAHGLTPSEIAEHLVLPDEFARHGHTRGYYGHLRHNIHAVYQRYLSWYDANPAHLHPHTPVDAGSRYVEFMGGPDALLAKAQRSFDSGDYRWVVEVVNHLVFADPGNQRARDLQADAFEQLGYQSESSTYRNAYLTGAQELRSGAPAMGEARGALASLSIDLAFDALAVRLKAEEVVGVRAIVNWTFTDIDEQWVLGLEHQALHASANRQADDADVSVVTTRATLLAVLAGATSFVDAIAEGRVTIEGDHDALLAIFGHLDRFTPGFNIVEP